MENVGAAILGAGIFTAPYWVSGGLWGWHWAGPGMFLFWLAVGFVGYLIASIRFEGQR